MKQLGVKYMISYISVVKAVSRVHCVPVDFYQDKSRSGAITAARANAFALLSINYSRDDIARFFAQHRSTTYNTEEAHKYLMHSNHDFYEEKFSWSIRILIRNSHKNN